MTKWEGEGQKEREGKRERFWINALSSSWLSDSFLKLFTFMIFISRSENPDFLTKAGWLKLAFFSLQPKEFLWFLKESKTDRRATKRYRDWVCVLRINVKFAFCKFIYFSKWLHSYSCVGLCTGVWLPSPTISKLITHPSVQTMQHVAHCCSKTPD